MKISSELHLWCTIHTNCSTSIFFFLLNCIRGFKIFGLQIRLSIVQDLYLLSGLVPVTERCILKFTFFSFPLFTLWKLWDSPDLTGTWNSFWKIQKITVFLCKNSGTGHCQHCTSTRNLLLLEFRSVHKISLWETC